MAMISVLLVTFLGFFVSLSQGYTFYVGGRDGWVLNPKEEYIHWAERNRFQINDTLSTKIPLIYAFLTLFIYLFILLI